MFPQASQNAIDKIKFFEGFRARAYPDVLNPSLLTIGFGSTIGVKQGDIITELQASARLEATLKGLQLMLNRALTVGLGQNQADALYSLVYNVGIGRFLASRFHRKLNATDPTAPAEFLDWDHDAQGHEIEGLKKRRVWEHTTFLLDPWPTHN